MTSTRLKGLDALPTRRRAPEAEDPIQRASDILPKYANPVCIHCDMAIPRLRLITAPTKYQTPMMMLIPMTIV
jgi:hypothetical protein